MHEQGIAQQMVTLALQQAQENQAQRVTQFHIEISRAADESEDSLRFYLEMLTRGTPAEGAAFEIQRVPVRARCLECGGEFEPENLADPCPYCSSVRVIHAHAEEFRLSSIEIE